MIPLTIFVIGYLLIGLVLGWATIRICWKNKGNGEGIRDFAYFPITLYMISWPLLIVIGVLVALIHFSCKLDDYIRRGL
jgi:hypothetical protein